MPRVVGGGGRVVGGRGIVVSGVYQALLDHERGKYDDPHYWDPRWMRKHHSGGEYRGQAGVVCEHEPPPLEYRRARRYLLERLEAGEPVTVPRWDVPSAAIPQDWRCRNRARSYRVGPDDTVVPRGG